MFQREIYVPFIQTYLWYQFQAFAAVFRKRELICTNSKHDYEAKLTSLNYFPFNQPMSRPVCPCKMVNNQQLCTCIIKPAKNSGLNGIRTQNLCDTSECRSYHWSIKLNGSCLLLEFVIYAPCDKSRLLNPWWGEEKKTMLCVNRMEPLQSPKPELLDWSFLFSLVKLVSSECEHRFIDKPSVVTEPALRSARLIEVDSKLYPKTKIFLECSKSSKWKALLAKCNIYDDDEDMKVVYEMRKSDLTRERTSRLCVWFDFTFRLDFYLPLLWTRYHTFSYPKSTLGKWNLNPA